MSLAEEEDVDLSVLVIGKFLTLEMDFVRPDLQEDIDRMQRLSSRLSHPQRTALARYFDWVDKQGWQCPLFMQAAKQCVLDGIVSPVPHLEFMTWVREQERRLSK